jgi:hypothetical protein
MKDEKPRQGREWLWGLPASVILHALLFSFLVYGLTKSPDQPKNDQAVDVSLVPAPEPPKPKPAPEPAKKEPELEKPQKTAEKPPPPEKAPENPPEQQKQQPNPPPAAEARPVFQYGDKDAGPRKSPDGSSAQDSAKSPYKADGSTPPAAAKDTDEKAVAAKEAGQQDAAKQPDGAEVPLAATGGENDVALPATADAPEPRPANAAQEAGISVAKSGPQGDSKLPGARRLSSQEATKDELATAAIAGLPRNIRGAALCSSALRQQLLDGSYSPLDVPAFSLEAGNVIECPRSAFSTQRARWYRLSFRCEVDGNATKVVSLTYHVGTPIPPREMNRFADAPCR